MKFFNILMSCILLFVFDEAKSNEILWSDEFEGDLSEWTQQTGGDGWGNEELQYYTNFYRNAITQNGFLKITARREIFLQNNYTSARLVSNKAFKYGIFEARLKVPKGRGTWPAFWVLSAKKPLSWPSDGDMDLMEHWGCNPGFVLSKIVTNNHVDDLKTFTYIPNIYDDFHVFKMDWNSDRIILYVDNVETLRYENLFNTHDSWPFNDSEFNIILNLAVDSKCANGVDNLAFPAEFIVDYVRQLKN